MKLWSRDAPEFKMWPLASREGRGVTGALVPVAESGLRDGVDNIGELLISE
jgi:hypothetical protein